MTDTASDTEPADDIPLADAEGVERTLRLSIWEGASYSVLVGFGEVYFIPLILAIGATDFQVGFFVAMIQLFLGFSQFAGLGLVERIRARKPIMIAGGFAHILFVLLMVIGVHSRKLSPLVFILLGGGYFASVGATIPSWTSLMGDMTTSGARGKYFSKRNSICQIVFFICMLAGGAILEFYDNKGAKLTGFTMILALALLGRVGSTYAYSRFYEGTYQYVKEAYFSFLDFLKRSGKSNFTRFVFFLSLMNMSTQIAGPYFVAYMLNDLHFSYIQFTIATSMVLVVQIFATRRWGPIVDRYGNRIVLQITGAMLPILPLLWFISTNFYYILFIQFLAGIAWGGWWLSSLNFTLDAVTAPKRARCSAYMNFTSCMGVFTGAMLGAFLSLRAQNIIHAVAPNLAVVSPLYLVFLVSSIAGLIVIAIFLRKFHEVRQVSDPDFRDMFVMLTHVRPFAGVRFRLHAGDNTIGGPCVNGHPSENESLKC